MPWSFTAAVGTVMVSPPQSSGGMPRSCICAFTRSRLAPFTSILLTATMSATLAFWMCFSASSVCGMKPSSAATTSTAMSVTLGAAGAHLVEGGVAGRVEEGDLAALELDLVGADVLGDAARLAGGDMGLADGVEQRGLAVVDVAEDADHRRPRHEELGLVLRRLLL